MRELLATAVPTFLSFFNSQLSLFLCSLFLFSLRETKTVILKGRDTYGQCSSDSEDFENSAIHNTCLPLVAVLHSMPLGDGRVNSIIPNVLQTYSVDHVDSRELRSLWKQAILEMPNNHWS